MNNIEDILFKSRAIFFHFVNECNKRYRSGDDLEYYQTIIQTHRKINNIETILEAESFLNKVRDTLVKWNMDDRAADLQSIEVISKNILTHKRILKDLYVFKLHKINSFTNSEGQDIMAKIKFVFKKLNVMSSKRQTVGVSKTMHFLLPDLIPPVDGKYTLNFFYGNNQYSGEIEKEYETFKDIMIRFHHITRTLNLSDSDIDDEKWNTSVPKLIDNAIIGFSKEFEEFLDNFQDEGIENFIKSVSNIASIDNYLLREYLEKRKNSYLNAKRKKIKEIIMRRKAREAGIKVSEEEIDDYLNKNKKI